ncbi:hypothetical protein [Devosia sp. BK]|uniref:hypothetical protein n=1 Tax=Devosia sp. BK TaxID=2871706 RepID=UPI00293BCE47|nr:hypothetical protein [Devosia sp. BK]
MVHVAAIRSIQGNRRELNRNTKAEALGMIDRLDATVREDQTLASFLTFMGEHLDHYFSGPLMWQMRYAWGKILKGVAADPTAPLLFGLSETPIDALYEWLLQAGLEPGTVYAYIGHIARALDVAIGQGRMESNPARAFHRKLERPKSRGLNLPAQGCATTLEPHLCEGFQLALGFSAYAALTSSESMALRGCDADLDPDYPIVRVQNRVCSRTGQLVPVNLADRRTVPLPDSPFTEQLRNHLRTIGRNDFVIQHSGTRRENISRTHMRRLFYKALEQAQVAAEVCNLETMKPFVPDDFRDRCIVDWLSDHEANVVKIQAQSGYANPEVFFNRYFAYAERPDAWLSIEDAITAMAEMV